MSARTFSISLFALLLAGAAAPTVAAQEHEVRARGTFDLGPLVLELQASRAEGLVFFLRPQHWAPHGPGERNVRDGWGSRPEQATDDDWHWARVAPDSASVWLAEARRLLQEVPVRHAAMRSRPRRRGVLPPPPSGPAVPLNGVDGARVSVGIDTVPVTGVAGSDGYLAIRSRWNGPVTIARAPRALLLELLEGVERGQAFAREQRPPELLELACAAPADGEPALQPAAEIRMPVPAINPQWPHRMQVFLEYAVDAEGRVVPASIRELYGDAPRWSEAVRQALLTAQYRPARVDGAPVASCVRRGWTFRSNFSP